MIVIVDNGGANLASILYALQRLGANAKLSADAHDIKAASHVILPGVGAGAYSMRRLEQLQLVETLRSLTQPVLGICLGMQILYDFSEEGEVACLGITPGKISRLTPQPPAAIPHMGWNLFELTRSSRLLKNLPTSNYVYYIHSYAAPITSATCAITDYNQQFTAVIEQDNFFGTQFHPEKSGKVGETILRNFLTF